MTKKQVNQTQSGVKASLIKLCKFGEAHVWLIANLIKLCCNLFGSIISHQYTITCSHILLYILRNLCLLSDSSM